MGIIGTRSKAGSYCSLTVHIVRCARFAEPQKALRAVVSVRVPFSPILTAIISQQLLYHILRKKQEDEATFLPRPHDFVFAPHDGMPLFRSLSNFTPCLCGALFRTPSKLQFVSFPIHRIDECFARQRVLFYLPVKGLRSSLADER